MPIIDFIELLNDEVDGKIRSATLGFSQTGRLVLGGSNGPTGGSGGPPGGFIGKLAQKYVTYDSTEASTLAGDVVSGSLVDNLNHIRYRIDNISGDDNSALHSDVANEINQIEEKESVIPDDIIVIEDSADIFSKKHITITTLQTTILSGISSLTIFGEDLTSQVPAISGIYTVENSIVEDTLRLYINGLRQRTRNYTVSGYYITISGTLLSEDDIVIDYTYEEAEESEGYGEGVYGGGSYGE